MEKTKKCPTCLKVHPENAETCECGFKFYIKPVEDEIAPTNTVVLYDPVPSFVWRLIATILPPLGFFFYFKWVEKWPTRSKESGRTAFVMSIVWMVVALILLFLVIGIKNGDVLV